MCHRLRALTGVRYREFPGELEALTGHLRSCWKINEIITGATHLETSLKASPTQYCRHRMQLWTYGPCCFLSTEHDRTVIATGRRVCTRLPDTHTPASSARGS